MHREAFVVGWVLIAAFGVARVYPDDTIPKLGWFAIPAIKLRTAPATNSTPVQSPELKSISGENEAFTLQAEKLMVPMEAQIQRYQSMNGKPLLQISPRRSAPDSAAGFLKSALDSVLPAKSTLFMRNPNARRDPLRPDD